MLVCQIWFYPVQAPDTSPQSEDSGSCLWDRFPLFELAQVYGTSCQVTGIDRWKEAVERAKSKLKVHQLPNVKILEADAAHLPFQENEFDLIVSNLGVNNFANSETALIECFRVAKPHASLVLTTNPVGHMRELYALFHEVLLELQKPTYLERLRRNEEHWGTKESLSGDLQAAGFISPRYKKKLSNSALWMEPLCSITY